MIKRFVILFKIGRKLAQSGILDIFSGTYSVVYNFLRNPTQYKPTANSNVVVVSEENVTVNTRILQLDL